MSFLTDDQAAAITATTRPTTWPKTLLAGLGWYFLPYLMVDLLLLVLLHMRVLYTLRTIFFAYTTNFILFPTLNLLWGVGTLLSERRRDANGVFHVRAAVYVALSVSLLAVFVYATFIEPTRIGVERITIVSDKVTAPITILHISDIQTNGVGRYEQRVFRLMRELRPDLILETGDALQIHDAKQRERELRKLAALFRELQPPDGIFLTEGDTDWATELTTIERIAALSGVKVLHDAATTLTTQAGTLRLLGLSRDQSRRGARARIAAWLARAPADQDLTIVFGHAPDYLRDVTDLPLDLGLAGHTHGGQIRLPFIGALVTFSNIPRAWAMGYREVGRTRINVSAGIGAEHAAQLPSIRLNCPPRMTLFTITPPR